MTKDAHECAREAFHVQFAASCWKRNRLTLSENTARPGIAACRYRRKTQ